MFNLFGKKKQNLLVETGMDKDYKEPICPAIGPNTKYPPTPEQIKEVADKIKSESASETVLECRRFVNLAGSV